MEYVVLMRGINVGGNRRVVMADLRGYLADAGAIDVQSYINSGNVLLRYDGDATELVAGVLAANYDFDITYTVIPAADYLAAVNAAPTWWCEETEGRYNALFKLPGYEDEYDQLIEAKRSDYDEVVYTLHVVFWRAPQKINYAKSFFAKMLSTPFYPVVSIRNRNTTLKLAEMVVKRLK